MLQISYNIKKLESEYIVINRMLVLQALLRSLKRSLRRRSYEVGTQTPLMVNTSGVPRNCKRWVHNFYSFSFYIFFQ